MQLEKERHGHRHNPQLTVPIEVPLVKKGVPSVLLDQAVLRSSDDGRKTECQGEDGICGYHLFKTTASVGIVSRGLSVRGSTRVSVVKASHGRGR